MEIFELTKEHVELLSNAYVDWEHGECGAPAIDPKRPYGNGDMERDVCQILGWFDYDDASDAEQELFSEGGGKYEKLWKRAEKIHLETETALQIILKFKTFKPGKFQRECSWEEWERV